MANNKGNSYELEDRDSGTNTYENGGFEEGEEREISSEKDHSEKVNKNGKVQTAGDQESDYEHIDKIQDSKTNGGIHEALEEVEPDNDKGAEIDGDDLQSRCWKGIYAYTSGLTDAYSDNKTIVKYIILVTVLLGYAAYLIYACIYDLDAAFVILIITGLTIFTYIYILIRDTKGDVIYETVLEPAGKYLDRIWPKIKWLIFLLIIAGLVVGLYFLTRENPENLISFAGLVFFLLFCYIFSKYPHRVQWRPVLWGLAIQLILGVLILRTYPGYILFEWLSDVVYAFLNFSSSGAIFLFGENYQDHFFAFSVLPIIIYFSSVISVLYYWGVMQVIVQKIAWLMQRTMKTSASESLNAAGNIFVGMTEAPLMIKPYLNDMTRSELHAVMTGGFATVAGSTLGAYILYGIDATHLITASVMSAPAALAISKLFYPETEKSKHVTEEDMILPKGDELNVVEAAANGASQAIPLVLNVAANLIAFLSLLALVNALLGYFGGLVGYPQLTFEFICSYVFIPLAFIMGVEWADCRIVAELIGLKTFVNEFYAYEVLGKYIENRTTGAGPTLSLRSEVIATYALCGFANIGSIGIVLGGLGPMAPNRKGDLASCAIRALIAGTVACFMTACIAGILYVPEDLPISNSTQIPDVTTMY